MKNHGFGGPGGSNIMKNEDLGGLWGSRGEVLGPLGPKGRKSEKKVVRGTPRGFQNGGQNPSKIDKKP